MPIIGIIDSAKSGNLSTNSFESIQTYTLGSSQSTITFSSIPTTYKHLQLRILWNNPVGDQSMYISFNGVETGGLYSFQSNSGSGSGTPAAAGGGGLNKIETFYDGNNSSNGNAKIGIMDILDYADVNKFKVARMLWGADYNGSGRIQLQDNLFRSTSAITTISLYPFSTSFAANTRIALYGIKGV